ncbi:hypothetical protein IPH92_00485 [Candidatus Kaiserbacteria bacterium]|nr:MAG: hypothetical protein IPH92_00485 [Candidatus Kaiserbacteria bacterium]
MPSPILDTSHARLANLRIARTMGSSRGGSCLIDLRPVAVFKRVPFLLSATIHLLVC